MSDPILEALEQSHRETIAALFYGSGMGFFFGLLTATLLLVFGFHFHG